MNWWRKSGKKRSSRQIFGVSIIGFDIWGTSYQGPTAHVCPVIKHCSSIQRSSCYPWSQFLLSTAKPFGNSLNNFPHHVSKKGFHWNISSPWTLFSFSIKSFLLQKILFLTHLPAVVSLPSTLHCLRQASHVREFPSSSIHQPSSNAV